MDQNVGKRRTREPNFTDIERQHLIQLALEKRSILESKNNDCETRMQKKMAWKDITDSFNATLGSNRSTITLKLKFEVLKKELKKMTSDNINSIDSSNSSKAVDSDTDRLLQLSPLSPTGINTLLSSTYDSDAVYSETEVANERDKGNFSSWPSDKNKDISRSNQMTEGTSQVTNGTALDTKKVASKKIVNSKFDALLQSKQELVDLQKKYLNNEEQRKIAHHNKQIELLDLEILIKKQELESKLK